MVRKVKKFQLRIGDLAIEKKSKRKIEKKGKFRWKFSRIVETVIEGEEGEGGMGGRELQSRDELRRDLHRKKKEKTKRRKENRKRRRRRRRRKRNNGGGIMESHTQNDTEGRRRREKEEEEETKYQSLKAADPPSSPPPLCCLGLPLLGLPLLLKEKTKKVSKRKPHGIVFFCLRSC